MAIYKEDIVDINLETGNIHRSFLAHSIGYKDQKADHFGVRVFRGKDAVDLTGVSVQGIFMPPQGDPIAITSGNSVSGNVAYVVLPQACYNYDGQFCLAIKLVDSTNSITGTVRIVDGVVDNTHASGTVAPTSAVPTYQEILSAYDAMVAATAAANGCIAATYSSSATYAVGDYCIHDGGLYRCTTAITTAEAWTSGHWTAAKLGTDLSAQKSAFVNTRREELNEYAKSVVGNDGYFPKVLNGYLDADGIKQNETEAARLITDYIPVDQKSIYQISRYPVYKFVIYYYANNNETACLSKYGYTSNEPYQINIPVGCNYIRFMFNNNNTAISPGNLTKLIIKCLTKESVTDDIAIIRKRTSDISSLEFGDAPRNPVFKVGEFDSNGQEVTAISTNDRLVSDYLPCIGDHYITVSELTSGIQILPIFYADNTGSNELSRGSFAGSPCSFKAHNSANYVRFYMKKSNGSKIMPSDVTFCKIYDSSNGTCKVRIDDAYNTFGYLSGQIGDTIKEKIGIDEYQYIGFDNGYLDSNGQETGEIPYNRLVSKYIPVTAGDKYEVSYKHSKNVTYTISFYASNDGGARNSYDSRNNNPYTITIPSGCNYIRIMLAENGNGEIHQGSIEQFNFIKHDSYLPLKDGIDEINLGIGTGELLTVRFGYYYLSNNKPVWSFDKTRMSTRMFRASKPFCYYSDSGYAHAMYIFDENGNNITSPHAYHLYTATKNYVNPNPNYTYVVFAKNSAGTTLSDSDLSHLHIKTVDDFAVQNSNLNYYYSGKRIELDQNIYHTSRMNIFIPYRSYSTQAIGIYGDTMMQVYDTGYYALIDLVTGECTDPIEITCGHGNTVCFTDVFYNENDLFPLVLISEAESGKSKVYINRITDEAATLVQAIEFDTSEAGFMANFVWLNGKMYGIGYELNQIYESTHTVISCYHFADNDLSTTPVFEAKHTTKGIDVLQGCTAAGKYLVIVAGGISYGGNHIAFYDPSENELVTDITDFEPGFMIGEPEGAAPYRGGLVVENGDHSLWRFSF